MSPLPDHPKAKAIKPFRLIGPPVAHQLPPDNDSLPPDLATVIDAWPTLPEAVRAGIVAIVRAAGDRGQR